MSDHSLGQTEHYDDTDELISQSHDTRWPQIFRRNRLRRLNNTDGDTDSHTTFADEETRRTRRTILVCGRQVPSIVIHILLSTASLILNIISIVAVPIYSGAILEAGGSLFFMNTFYGLCVTSVLFLGSLTWSLYSGWPGTMVHRASWKVMAGLSQLGCATMLLMNYTQDPKKTPAYLQAIMSVSLIPFTILMKFIFFQRKPSVETLICTLTIVVRILITSEPRIFGFSDDEAVVDDPDKTLAHQILWPAVFAFCHAPAAFVNCLQEKETKKEQVSSTGFMMWIHILNIFSFWSMFWTDIIPHIGTSSSIHDFSQRYFNGLECVFGLHPHCMSMLLAAWVTISDSFLRYIVSFLLIGYTEGAVYTSMITSMGSPVGTVFWSLFRLYPTLHWEPRYTKSTTYTLVGLAFMMPAVVIYNYISYKEENKINGMKKNDTFNANDDDFVNNPHDTEDEVLQSDSVSITGYLEIDGGLYNL